MATAGEGMNTTGEAPRVSVLEEAREYLDLLHKEGVLTAPGSRLRKVRAEIEARGTYRQTFEELEYGAMLAWRHSTRCVGRKYWPSLTVRDCRHLETPQEIFGALVDHLRLSTNGGTIRPMITVLPPEEPGRPGLRIWNEQLIRYAGYRRPDGSVLGDPRQTGLTEAVRSLGWPGGEGTPFDILPVVLQTPDGERHLFELPRNAVLEVEIEHPDLSWFRDFGLKWHALPAISSMCLEVGGVRYTAAPFSGWYMLTEIAARNFADEDRYNLLPAIARKLGLSTRSEENLWRDRALLELNLAVLHSFRRVDVKIIDHHTVSRHFVEFEGREKQHGRPTYAEWAWIVPPLSGSTTPLFHRSYENVELKPNFFYQDAPWQAAAAAAAPPAKGCPFHMGSAGSGATKPETVAPSPYTAAPTPRATARRKRSA